MIKALSPLYGILEYSFAFTLLKKVAKPTVARFEYFIDKYVKVNHGENILDLACGVGDHRHCFPREGYYGLDFNSNYIETAKKESGGSFSVMDCTQLGFAPNSFDNIFCMASTHHLSPEQIHKMLREAASIIKPGGKIHILDVIFPLSKLDIIKYCWFRLDRGEYPRHEKDLRQVLQQSVCRITNSEVLTGPVHDVAYYCLEM